jgi:hypothetical protein
LDSPVISKRVYLGWFQFDSPAISKGGLFWDGLRLTPLKKSRGGLSEMVSVGLPCNSPERAFLGWFQLDSPVIVKRRQF